MGCFASKEVRQHERKLSILLAARLESHNMSRRNIMVTQESVPPQKQPPTEEDRRKEVYVEMKNLPVVLSEHLHALMCACGADSRGGGVN